ncbi:MAG: DNA polymerase III subunit gamma/tau [Candidatus Latescibacter sp.]|nr:DNA polymerase III subunit gamma/tau [Candidatus Latescibacter sp.]
MSYIVTARKWRPQFFREVVSQKHVTETLQNAIKSGNIGHAYLFSGPRGVGKTTVARIFAKALNCEKGLAEEPCNECPTCLSIQSGASMDILEMDGASNNSVDDARELISNVSYHSLSRYKMYIIDEVHMLSKEAFNALLKTLEEPPPGVMFVFATTEPQKIPATILSRCQRFDFRRLSVQEIAGKLKKIAETDSITADESALMLIARRASGAMRDGESILEQLKASRGASISVADVNEILGLADHEVFFGMIDRCHERDTRGVLELFTVYHEQGGDLKEFVEGLLGHLRDLLYAKFKGGIDQIPLSDDMKGRIRTQSGWFEQGDIIRMITMVTDVESSLGYAAVMPVLRIEVALARMAVMETTVELKRLFELLGGESALTGAPIPLPQPGDTSGTSARAIVASGSAQEAAEKKADADLFEKSEEKPDFPKIAPDIDSISSSWKYITDRVSIQKPAIGPVLALGVPESFEKGKLAVRFNAGQEFQMKTCAEYSADIEEIIGTILGMKVAVHVFVRRSGAAKKKNNEIDDLISREPIIGDILERFEGEISDSWRE